MQWIYSKLPWQNRYCKCQPLYVRVFQHSGNRLDISTEG